MSENTRLPTAVKCGACGGAVGLYGDPEDPAAWVCLKSGGSVVECAGDSEGR